MLPILRILKSVKKLFSQLLTPITVKHSTYHITLLDFILQFKHLFGLPGYEKQFNRWHVPFVKC